MRYLYSFFCYLLIPVVLLRLVWRGRRISGYLDRWLERFGFIDLRLPAGGIWIHAVSVGETVAAASMIKKLQDIYPQLPITITTTTPTGSQRVVSLFGDRVFHTYAPYDLPGAVKRFIKKVKPSLLILMETELWPNTIHYAVKNDVKVMVANARLSQKSAKGYAWPLVYPLTKKMLGQLSIVAAQSQPDLERFVSLGLDPDRGHVTGSVKFDISVPASVVEQADAIRDLWGRHRPVWIAASTHEGEEELVLKVFEKVRSQLANLLLVLVPRHPERFTKVANLVRKQGYEVVLRSEGRAVNAEASVFVGDTMGELELFYPAADLAFVGGSLLPIGGHNLLEPAAVGTPAITGKYIFNFTEITALLREAGAVRLVKNIDELAETVLSLLQDSHARAKAGEAGRKVIEQNRGAVVKHITLIKQLLQHKQHG